MASKLLNPTDVTALIIHGDVDTLASKGRAKFSNPHFNYLTYEEYYEMDEFVKNAVVVCYVCKTEPASSTMSRFESNKGLCWICRTLSNSVRRESALETAHDKELDKA